MAFRYQPEHAQDFPTCLYGLYLNIIPAYTDLCVSALGKAEPVGMPVFKQGPDAVRCFIGGTSLNFPYPLNRKLNYTSPLAILSSSPDVMVQMSGEGFVTGWSVAEVMGKSLHQLIVPHQIIYGLLIRNNNRLRDITMLYKDI
ncbi:MAG: hypothetical protein GY806_16840 [Gammaproteobacteria bacterium]|nr:hypothetical protein [Gammaproteobacteria bacterium]